MASSPPLPPLDHIAPGLVLRVSPQARRMALRLDSARRTVALVVPRRYSLRKAEAFAREHQAWIAEKLAALPDPVPFAHGARVPVLGRERRLDITCDPALKRTDIFLEDHEIIVRTNKPDPAARIVRFLKAEARDTLDALAREKAAETGREITDVQVRETRSRWGSCGADGQLSFCWRLIFAPWAALDYVAAHEVAHLVHRDHSPRFWALCADLSEEFLIGRTWLRERGTEILRYGIVDSCAGP